MQGRDLLTAVYSAVEYLAIVIFRCSVYDQYRDHIRACSGIIGDGYRISFAHNAKVNCHTMLQHDFSHTIA
jgi:hypothetical protein